jgi:hypothetical protein
VYWPGKLKIQRTFPAGAAATTADDAAGTVAGAAEATPGEETAGVPIAAAAATVDAAADGGTGVLALLLMPAGEVSIGAAAASAAAAEEDGTAAAAADDVEAGSALEGTAATVDAASVICTSAEVSVMALWNAGQFGLFLVALKRGGWLSTSRQPNANSFYARSSGGKSSPN